MFVGIYVVITAVNQSNFEIYERITGNRAVLRGFDDSFFNRRTEILRNRAAEDFVNKFKTAAAFERFKNAFAIAELSASAGLFFVSSLNFDLRRNRFFIRNFRRMQRDFDVITVFQFINDRFDVKLSRTAQNKFFGLRIAVKMQTRVFF